MGPWSQGFWEAPPALGGGRTGSLGKHSSSRSSLGAKKERAQALVGVITSVMALPPGGYSFPGGSQVPVHLYPQHISSRRHRDGVAGKPNPLLSRHKKPRGAGELAVRPGCWKIRQLGDRSGKQKGTRVGLGEVGCAGPTE